MKKLFTFTLFLLAGLTVTAQGQNPVNWIASYRSISATEGEIVITALIEMNWHTYSQIPVKDGPIPTTFSFTPTKDFELVGATEESKPEEEFVEAFGTKVFHFSNKAEFRQKVKLKGKSGFPINFTVEYMCCDNKMCLPPKTLSLSVKTL